MPLDPRLAMTLFGAGRVAIGLGLVAVPAVVGKRWIGAPADEPGGQVSLRALGARDALLGLMAIHVAGAADPMVAARWSSAIALCDVVDGVSTAAVGSSLPSRGVPVTALALGSAALGFALSAQLRS